MFALGEQLHHHVVAQRVAVVGILVPAGNLRHALVEHLLQGVLHQPTLAPVLHHGCYFADDAAVAFRLFEHCQPAAGGKCRIVERGRHFSLV